MAKTAIVEKDQGGTALALASNFEVDAGNSFVGMNQDDFALPFLRLLTTTSPEVRARVVYIEDNPVNTLLVQELLGQRPGIRLETAPDGLTGVDLVKKTLPDLVLIDMQLPDIDGDEVFRRLRRDAATAQIPCIALSANAMSNDIEAARSMGFNDYWTKPIDVAAFLSDIDAFFDL